MLNNDIMIKFFLTTELGFFVLCAIIVGGAVVGFLIDNKIMKNKHKK